MWEILVMAGIFAAIIFGLGLASAKGAREKTLATKRREPQSEKSGVVSKSPYDMAARGVDPDTLSGSAREKMAATGK